VADHFAFGGLAGLPDVRAGRSGAALHDRPHRRGAQHAGQLAGPQVGVHLHDARDVRRGVLRLVPVVLLHVVRRGVLRLDGHSAVLRHSGRGLRIPPQTGQRLRRTDLQRLPARQRRVRPAAHRHGRGNLLHGGGIHRRPPQPGQPGRRGGDLAVGDAVARAGGRRRVAQRAAGPVGDAAGHDAGLPVLYEQHRRRGDLPPRRTPHAHVRRAVRRLLRGMAPGPRPRRRMGRRRRGHGLGRTL